MTPSPSSGSLVARHLPVPTNKLEAMDVEDFSELAKFVFDCSTPESDDELRIDVRLDAPSSDHSVPPVRTGRKRARKACVACHKRKVRCDVLSRGHTCTNCRLDGVTCAVRSGRKQMRGKPAAQVEELPVGSPAEATPSQLICPTDAPATIVPFAVQSIEMDPGVTSAGLGRAPSPRPFPTHSGSTQLDSHTDMIFAYFDFLETETLSHIAPEDFKFLEYKGCFHIPQRPILDDLVREYFLHVHPVLPVLDERLFWEIYIPGGSRTGRRKVPLFVFRAMLFVSCSFASDNTIRRLGFQSALEARCCMYSRAKLLYDFNTTSDPITVAQAALLLTYYSSDSEPLANTLWLRLAIQYALSSNVPMYDQDTSITIEEKLIRKRLWWCLILRDRILPLGVRRPIQITRDNFDFSQSKLSARDLEPEFGSSRVYDRETKIVLAGIFLSQLDLAIELTDPIAYIYPANGFRSYDELDGNATLLTLSKIEQCRTSLGTWNSKFRKSIPSSAVSSKHKSVSLYSGLTSIYYQSACAALCQYESFLLQTDDSTTHELRLKQLGSSLHSAVASICQTIRDFLQLDVAKYLPVSAVAYLALPIVLNSLDLQTLTPANARTEAKRRQLRLLNEAMDLCHERYTGSLSVKSVINRTIRDARSEHDFAEDQITKSTALLCPSSTVKNWFDVFVSKPTQYLRISFTIDISFSMGRYPDTEDYLPQRLSLQNRLIPSQSIPRTLMLSVEDTLPNTDQFDEAARVESARNIHLDYLDFSEPETWGVSEGNPWNGQTVERMLDEALRG